MSKNEHYIHIRKGSLLTNTAWFASINYGRHFRDVMTLSRFSLDVRAALASVGTGEVSVKKGEIAGDNFAAQYVATWLDVSTHSFTIIIFTAIVIAVTRLGCILGKLFWKRWKWGHTKIVKAELDFLCREFSARGLILVVSSPFGFLGINFPRVSTGRAIQLYVTRQK